MADRRIRLVFVLFCLWAAVLTAIIFLDTNKGPGGDLGPTGEVGEVGERGPQGPTGLRGSQGPLGLDGDSGPIGEQGVPGTQGTAGMSGPAGPQGSPGASGPRGSQGLQGDEGKVGDQGDTGPRGAQGQVGETGPAGPRGPRGLIGTPLPMPVANIRVDSIGYYPGDSVILQGSGFSSSNLDFYLISGTSNTETFLGSDPELKSGHGMFTFTIMIPDLPEVRGPSAIIVKRDTTYILSVPILVY